MGLFTPANREHILGHVLFLIFIQKQIRTYFIKQQKLCIKTRNNIKNFNMFLHIYYRIIQKKNVI